MPKPPVVRSSDWSPWVKRSKISGSRAGGMPMPLSLTLMTASRPSRRVRMRICPPRRVYLIALVTRLVMICSSRVGSASTHSSLSVESEMSRSCSRSPMSGCAASTERWMTSPTLTGCRRNSILPAVMRATSNRSSTSRLRLPVWRSITVRASSMAWGSVPATLHKWTALLIAESGFPFNSAVSRAWPETRPCADPRRATPGRRGRAPYAECQWRPSFH